MEVKEEAAWEILCYRRAGDLNFVLRLGNNHSIIAMVYRQYVYINFTAVRMMRLA